MKAHLVTGTTGNAAAPMVVARAIAAYTSRFRPATRVDLLPIADPLPDIFWPHLWQTVVARQQGDRPLLLVYPGSLGDAVTPETTVADWARDWRMPLVLTLPERGEALSLAAAFAALAHQAGAEVVGFVGVGVPIGEREELGDRIAALTHRPFLGHLPIAPAAEANPSALAEAAAQLDWELMPWSCAGCPL